MGGSSTDKPRPSQDRTLGVTILGPDPRAISAYLLNDDRDAISAGFVDPAGSTHFAFRVEGRFTGGCFLRAESPGYVAYDKRLKIGGNPDDVDIGMPLGDAEMDLVTLVPLWAAPPSRAGIVTVDGKAIRDAGGLFHGRGLTWFWVMQALMTGGSEEDRLLRNIDWLMHPRRKPDFVRILCEVGTSGNLTSSWTGLEIDWTQPKWRAKGQETLTKAIDLFWKQYGIRLELTILGKGTNTDPVWLAGLVGDVVADGRQEAIMDIEMVNESGSGTEVSLEVMKKMAIVLKGKVPNILALSSPMEGGEAWKEMEDAAKALGLKGFSIHQRRKMIDQGWGYVRQGFDNKNTKLVALLNENKGHADSSGGLTDLLLLASTVAVNKTCGAATHVAHSGTGVYGNGKSHPVGGKRPPNFYDIPLFDEQLDAQWSILNLIPLGIQNWSVRNTQNAGVPLDLPKSMHQGTGYEESSGFGVNKAYAAVSPLGEFVQLPCGVKMADDKPCPMDVMFSMKDVTIFDMRTLQPIAGLENFSVGRGDKIPIPAREDGMTASIVRGKQA